MLRRHGLFGGLVIIAFILVLVAGETLVTAVAALSLAWNLITHLYRTVDRFRLVVDRWRMKLGGRTVSWSMRCDFPVADALSSWDKAKSVIDGRLARGDRRLSEQPGNVVYVMNGVTVQVSATGYEDPIEGRQNDLRIEFPAIEGTLGSWERRIEDDIVALLRSVEKAVVHEPATRFEVEISYAADENPYFGYFLTRAEGRTIARFAVDYYEVVADEKTLVQVRQDHLSFVVNSIDALRRLSMQFLALRAPTAG